MVFSAPLSAFTINHGGEQSTGENLHLSYHDNLHYSSVRDNKSSEKPSDANNVFGNLEQSYNAPKNGTKPTKQENEENEKPNEQRPPEDLEDTTHSNNPRPKQSTISPKMSKPKKGDPCPCGSGQKYKKCCLVKEKHAARLQKMKKKEEEVDPAKEDVEQQDANVEMNGKFRVLQI